MTREEAEKELQMKTTKFLSKFCPLIRGTCRADCQSFWHGEIYEKAYVEGYVLSVPTCNCPLVSGVINVGE